MDSDADRAKLGRVEADLTSEAQLPDDSLTTITPGAPLYDIAKDELGRARFAKHLARALVRYEHPESLVVALYGIWGTGKSTLLNFTETELSEFPEAQRPIVVRFNPWNYSDQSELVSQFFDVLSIALARPDLAAQYEKASKLLETLSRRSNVLESLPHIGALFKKANWAAQIFSRGLNKQAEDERDLGKIKADISSVLRANARKVIVILDDIDRLSSAEIRQMFQLVKALADFANVTYFLAFDRTVVVPALEKVQEGSGQSYLEKIVNVPIEVPVITRQQIQNMLSDRVDAFANKRTEYNWSAENNHFVQIMQKLNPLFSTIRALDRFANVLSFGEGLVEGEVDYADFIAISALQSVNPSVYQFVRENESLFVDSPMRRLMTKKDDDTKDREAIDAALKLCAPEAVQLTLDLLTEMFPRLESLYGSRSFSDDAHAQWERERRICANSEVFRTYFQLDVPVEGFSAKRLRVILSDMSADSFAAAFHKLVEEERALAFLREFENYFDDPRVREHATDIVHVLFNNGDVFGSDLRQYPISVDGQTLVLRIVYQITRRVPEEEARFECLRNAIDAATDSLFTPVHTISVEDQTANRYNLGGSGDVTRRLVNDRHLDELETRCRLKIETWARDGRLVNHRDLGYILYRWANWGGGDALSSFVLNGLTNEQFIRLFERIGFTTAQARSSDTPMLYGPEVDPLAPIAEVRRRLQAIAGSEQAKALPADLKATLAALLKPPDDTDGGGSE